jgi:hypothetical protein
MGGRASKAVIDAMTAAGRPMSVSELNAVGASRATLHRMAEAREIERLAHGIYGLPELDSPFLNWAALSVRVPSAVFCLTSAATFHRITQNMEARSVVAVPHDLGQVQGGKGKAYPVRVRLLRLRSGESFTEGVDVHEIQGVPVRITSPERTVVDMFRFSDLNPRCRKVHVGDEAFLDCIAKALDPEAQIAQVDEIGRLAELFGVKEAITPFVQSFQHAINTGYMA